MTTHISIIRRIGVTLGLAISVSAVATSSGFAYSARAQQMCMGDAMRLCSSEIPNISGIIACMRRNKANVSAGCRSVMEQEDPASRPKPVQAAPVEPKPPVAARAEQPAVKPKPVAIVPHEQKPAVAARAEQPVPVVPKPAPAVPVAAAPATAAPAAVETKPAQGGTFEQRTITVSVEQTHRPRVNPFRRLAGRKPAALSILTQAAVAEAKLNQAAPLAAAPVAQPAKPQIKPVQEAAVMQRPAVALPPAAKPVEAKVAPVARSVKVVQRKQKTRQVAVAAYSPHEGGGYERYMKMAAPIMSLIMSYW